MTCCQAKLTVTRCDGTTFQAHATIGIVQAKRVEDHPYVTETLRVWLNTERVVSPGFTIVIDDNIWTISEVRSICCTAALEVTRASAVACAIDTFEMLQLSEADDCGKELSEGYPVELQVIFQRRQEAIANQHEGRQWEQEARIYFLDGLPDITPTTLFRYDDTDWKPRSAHDVNVIGKLPYVKAVKNPWRYAA